MAISWEIRRCKDYTCGVDLKPYRWPWPFPLSLVESVCSFFRFPPYASSPPCPLQFCSGGSLWSMAWYGVALCCMHLSESVTSYGSKYFGHIPRQSHIRCLCMHHLVMGFSGPRRIFWNWRWNVRLRPWSWGRSGRRVGNRCNLLVNFRLKTALASRVTSPKGPKVLKHLFLTQMLIHFLKYEVFFQPDATIIASKKRCELLAKNGVSGSAQVDDP